MIKVADKYAIAEEIAPPINPNFGIKVKYNEPEIKRVIRETTKLILKFPLAAKKLDKTVVMPKGMTPIKKIAINLKAPANSFPYKIGIKKQAKTNPAIPKIKVE